MPLYFCPMLSFLKEKIIFLESPPGQLLKSKKNMVKKLFLSGTILVSFLMVSLQTQAQSFMQKRASYYAEQAAEEFGLSGQEKEQIYETKLAQMKVNQAISKRNKNREFASDEEHKAARREAMKPFAEKMMEITGVKRKELGAFNRRVNEEMKAMKED